MALVRSMRAILLGRWKPLGSGVHAEMEAVSRDTLSDFGSGWPGRGREQLEGDMGLTEYF